MRVFPIKDKNIILKMKEKMRENSDIKMLLLFTIGINTGFRISDILKLTYEILRSERIILTEQKTGKKKDIPVPPAVKKVFVEYDDGSKGLIFLSKSNRNRGGVWSRQFVAGELKFYAELAGFNRNTGTHTMRKTFGYWRYMQNGKNIGLVQDLLNHSSSKDTIRYIGIDEEVRDNAYASADQQL